MSKKSAGLLVYRYRNNELEILIVHPGGPFWAKKDLGSWSIPKGEYEEGEDPLEAAKREFREETGFEAQGTFIELKAIKQPSGKTVYAWAVEGDYDSTQIKSNTFKMEWPPRSGRQAEFPEVDRAEWFQIENAKQKLLKGHLGFVYELCEILGVSNARIESTTQEPDKKSSKEEVKPQQRSLFE